MPATFEEYYNMVPKARKSLPSVNFWLIAAGREPIAVPAEDEHYKKYFTQAMLENAKRIFALRESGFLPMKVISIDEPQKIKVIEVDAVVELVPRERIQPPPLRQKPAAKTATSAELPTNNLFGF